jgi:hypothetical protein
MRQVRTYPPLLVEETQRARLRPSRRRSEAEDVAVAAVPVAGAVAVGDPAAAPALLPPVAVAGRPKVARRPATTVVARGTLLAIAPTTGSRETIDR